MKTVWLPSQVFHSVALSLIPLLGKAMLGEASRRILQSKELKPPAGSNASEPGTLSPGQYSLGKHLIRGLEQEPPHSYILDSQQLCEIYICSKL